MAPRLKHQDLEPEILAPLYLPALLFCTFFPKRQGLTRLLCLTQFNNNDNRNVNKPEKRKSSKEEKKKSWVNGRVVLCTHITGVSVFQGPLDRNQTGNLESLPNALPLPALPSAPGGGSRMFRPSSAPWKPQEGGASKN